MKIRITLILSFMVILFCPRSKAQDYAASIKVSTLGVNVEAIRSFGSNLNVRLGAAYFSYTLNDFANSNDYSAGGDLNLLSFSTLADWFPFETGFRITGGLMINLNKASITLTPKKTYTDGNTQYTPEKLGNITAEIDFNKVAPYLGIGFGNPTSGSSGLGFTLDIGTFYQGGPKASMSASKLLEPSASQGPILEENLKWFKFYPVLSFGLTYKF